MSEVARQSTARTVMVGPILDADGVAVTGGVVGDLKISKNGAAPAALDVSATLTHRHTGHYSLALTATDLNTVGTAQVTIDDTVNCMPPKEITVIEEAVYDAIYAASANAFTGAAGSSKVTGVVLTDTVTTYTGDTPQTGDSFARIGAGGVGLTEAGGDGDHLTAINLPNQTMDIVGNITGSLSGSVGSVTGLTASNLDATVSSRSSQASVDDLPTNAELATALAAADDAVLAQVAIVLGHIDTEITTLLSGVADIPTNAELATALAAADDAVLSAIAALNNLSSAQAQTAAAAALEAIHLDHLLAADYDPASKPGVATALLNELIESDAGVSQFTANALEEAPSGGGGGDTIIVSPLESENERRVEGLTFDLYQGEHGSTVGPIRVTDANGAVDLSLITTLEFVITNNAGVELQQTAHASITLGDDEDGVTSTFSFEVDDDVTEDPTGEHVSQHHYWALWDITTPDRILLARGRCPVLKAAVPTP